MAVLQKTQIFKMPSKSKVNKFIFKVFCSGHRDSVNYEHANNSLTARYFVHISVLLFNDVKNIQLSYH